AARVGVGRAVTAQPDEPSDGDEQRTHALPEIGAWRSREVGRAATGADVRHPEYGHGWVRGSGHGRVSVRFETAATGAGRMPTFSEEDPVLEPADPLDSLGW